MANHDPSGWTPNSNNPGAPPPNNYPTAQPLPAQPIPAQPVPPQPNPAQPVPIQQVPGQPYPHQAPPGQPQSAQPIPAQPQPYYGQPQTWPQQPGATGQPAQPYPAQPYPAQPIPVQPNQPQYAQPQPVPIQPASPIPANAAPGGNIARPMPLSRAGGVGGAAPIAQSPDGSIAIRTDRPARPADQDDEEEGPPREWKSFITNAPPWLVSTIVHASLLIILALIVFYAEPSEQINLEIVYAEDLGEQLEEEAFEIAKDDLVMEEQVITPDELPPVDDPLAAPPMLDPLLNANTATSQIAAPTVGLALQGRSPGMKKSLLSAYGGTALTEGAVLNGLQWLVRQQNKDGSWSLTGPYANGGPNENRVAATAMALLAFQGAGHTHAAGPDKPFGRVVSRGWDYLLKQQDRDGQFVASGPINHRLYSHGQAMIAVCEMWAMTQDQRFKAPAENSVKFALKAQDPDMGGWRYTPGNDSDLSVSGWYMMGLQSARMAYIPVPDDSLNKLTKFLDSVAIPEHNGAQYLYKPGSHGGPAMTAEGLLCRQYLGWKQDDPRLAAGAGYINRIGMDWGNRNCYFWYYAAQVCHHLEGEPWKRWNRVMRQLLPERQLRDGGERGSWDPDGDEWGSHGGRLFVTCMHIYCLEVYYRHLPIYKYADFGG